MAEYESDPEEMERVRQWLVSQGVAPPRPGDQVAQQQPPAPTPQQQGWPPQLAQQGRPIDMTPPAMAPLPKRTDPMDMGPEVAGVTQAAQRHAWAAGKVREAQDAAQAPARAFQGQMMADNERAALANAGARQTASEDYQDRLALYRNKLKREAESANPDSYFEKTGVWGNLMLGIAMAASGWMNPRGPNQAVAMIEHNIDRYIMSEDKKRARRGEALALEGQAIDAEGKAGEAGYRSAEEKRAIIWELANNKLKSMANATSNEAAKASILEAQYAAEQKAAEATLDAFKTGIDAKARIQVAKIGAGPDYARVAEDKRQHKEDLQFGKERELHNVGMKGAQIAVAATTAEAAKTRADKYQPGGAGSALRPVKANGEQIGFAYKDDWKETMHVVDTHREIDDTMNKIIDLAGGTSLWDRRSDVLNLGSEKVHKIDALYADLIAKIAHGEGFGANLTAAEIELIKRRIGTGADTWTTKDLRDRLSYIRGVKAKYYEGYLRDHLVQAGEGAAPGAAPPGVQAPDRPDDEKIEGLEDN